MTNLTCSVGDNTTLKWTHDGTHFCCHIMQDELSESPLNDEMFVQLAFFGRNYHMGNDSRSKGVDPNDYLVQLCRDHVEPSTVIDKIKAGRLPNITIKTESNGLITLTDTTTDDVFESVQPNAIIDILANNLTISNCHTILEDDVYILPVWAYEHSGITIKAGERTYPYNDQWDSYQTGYGVITKADVMREYNSPETNWKQNAARNIESTVELYDKYLNGCVYGFQLYKYENGEWQEDESVWGFIGDDIIDSGLAEAVDNGLVDAIKNQTVVTDKAEIKTITVIEFGEPK